MKRAILDANIYGEMVIDRDIGMLTENAVRAYKLVNPIIKKRTPDFIKYEEFKRRLLRG